MHQSLNIYLKKMKRKIRCKLGFHRPVKTDNEIKLWRWNDHYFDIMEKC